MNARSNSLRTACSRALLRAAAAAPGFLIGILPPGAFIVLGCMVAWKNWVEARAAEREQRPIPEPVANGGCH